MTQIVSTYRGRLAPSPTGLLHLGHARTFWIATQRARAAGGTLRLRNDDLDRNRCRPEFVDAMLQDLKWLGLEWDGPVIRQSDRLPRYREVLAALHAGGWIFPCTRTRRDVLEAAGAPHEGGDAEEPVYPAHFRPTSTAALPPLADVIGVNWRFRVPDGRRVGFIDPLLGQQEVTAGVDFGDFLVWRRDNLPSYQLACVVDDADFEITEVVRGADLVMSTARQQLLFEALGIPPPAYAHCPLLHDEKGRRLAKRSDALSLRALREQGLKPASLLAQFERETILETRSPIPSRNNPSP